MKERLTGAIILVALIVLLVPELLTGPIRSAPRTAVAASSTEEPPLRSYTINLGEDARSRSGTAGASGPAQPAPLASAQADTAAAPKDTADTAQPAATVSAPAQPQAAVSPPTTPAPSAPAPAARAKPAASANAQPATSAESGGFMVQLGSFASRANAEGLAQRVRAQGFQVSVSQGASGRRLYRVRVGPAHDHAAAAQLAQKLHAAGHSGPIVPK